MTTENNTPDPAAEAAAAAAAAEAAAKAAAPLSLDPAGGDPAKPPVSAQTAVPDPKAKEGEVTPVVYNPTGDDGLDMALKFVGDLGYTPDHPAMKAAMEGDFTMLEAELATKGVKGSDAYMKLGKQAFERTRAKTLERQAADRKAVEEAAGGAESWKDIQAWASKEASPEERTEISAALSKGGLQAQMAVTWLKGHYEKAMGAAPTDGPGKEVAVVKEGAGKSGALDRREYAAAVAEARRNFKGHNFETSPVYKSLQARRLAYRG